MVEQPAVNRLVAGSNPAPGATTFTHIVDSEYEHSFVLFVLSLAILQKGGNQMPTKVNVELIIVWACVGFFTGAGWAVATWLVGRILGMTHL